MTKVDMIRMKKVFVLDIYNKIDENIVFLMKIFSEKQFAVLIKYIIVYQVIVLWYYNIYIKRYLKGTKMHLEKIFNIIHMDIKQREYYIK